MLTVIETPVFQQYAAQVWRPEEIEAFIAFISINPLAGDVIPGAEGLRKIRWGRAGMGKRGGARVIYYTRLTQGEIVLLIAYTKSKFDNLSPEFLKKLREHFDVS